MNKKVVLFFNIGNRNILYRNEIIDKDNLRHETEKLWENYDKEKQFITTQIVDPLIEKFRNTIHKIVLIVTDQEGSEYAVQDTLFIGEIIRKKIKEKYEIKNISIKKYESNPTDFDRILPYMRNLLRNYESDGFLKVICNSGGTPQMKQALLLSATNYLTADELEAYQIDEKSGEVKFIDLSNTLRAEFVKRTCLDFIKKYEYAAAAEIIQKNLPSSKVKDIVLSLLNYGKHRLTFDFKTANKHLESCKQYLSSVEFKEIEKLKIEINTRAEKIIELFRNFVIQWEKENYVEFLGRLFRLEEEIYYYFIEKKFGIDLTDEKNHRSFLEKVIKLPGIHQKKYKGKPLKTDRVSKPLIFLVLDSFPEYQNVTRNFNKIGNYLGFKNVKARLDDLRNKSIMAHGFDPVSREIVEKNYPESIEKLFDNFKDVIRQISEEENIQMNDIYDYQYLNERIKKYLI